MGDMGFNVDKRHSHLIRELSCLPEGLERIATDCPLHSSRKVQRSATMIALPRPRVLDLPVYDIDHFTHRSAGKNEGNAAWVLKEGMGAPIPSGNPRAFLNIYPGQGDVGGLGDFKDMMHGYWIFPRLAFAGKCAN
jgi:hypothetical protein